MNRVLITPADIQRHVRWFSPDELKSKGNGVIFIDHDAVSRLDRLRDAWGRPLVIHSAYRDPRYNKLVGGAPGSYHMQGRAFDIGCTRQDMFWLASMAADLFNGIILYPQKGFIHVDNREKPYADVICS